MQKTLFDEIEPFNTGHLSSKDGHDVYFEESGNPSGQPIIFLHGGPGGGTGPKQRRFFDPNHYRIILFDQRGCGQSSPAGEIVNNTTNDLINDIETIRKHLNIDKWFLFGGSWGSTLALAYFVKFPELVKGLILRGIFLSRPFELDWFLKGVEIFFPKKYEKLLSFHHSINKKSLVTDYCRLVFGKDIKLAEQAAHAWNSFEGSILKLTYEDQEETPTINYPEELARARVQLHYIKNKCFVEGDSILVSIKDLNQVPTVIVQGQYDMVCPPQTADDLYKVMPHADFRLIPDAGHSASESGITDALIDATDIFKRYS